MLLKKLIQNYKILTSYLILGFFSFFINFYYASYGLFPIDSLAHFDTSYRILLGEFPFEDYWTISGPIIDYIQSIFFYFFGVSWSAYIFHPSILNSILTIFIFYFFLEIGINEAFSFFYALCFSFLAYTSSGTLFVDHHSTFFSLIAVLLIYLNFEKNSKLICFLIPILFFVAFFSKQVPASYIILFSSLIVLLDTFLEKKYILIKYYFLGFLFSLIVFFIIGYLSKISLENFLIQYIFYPQSLGNSRISNLNINFKNVFLDFKLIYFLLIPLSLIVISNLIKNKKNTFLNKNFYRLIIIILFVLSLIFHQLITQNQIFIFFLIPILAAILQFEMKKIKLNKTIYFFLIIVFTIYATQKYHFRFNENRKFQELVYVNIDDSIDARIIDPRLKNLKWITPSNKNPLIETEEIKISINFINQSKNNMMVITNYSFFSALTNKKLFSPMRWFIMNGNSHPLPENKYYNNYKKFLINKITKNNIDEIITIGIEQDNYIENLLLENCDITKNKYNLSLISHLIKNCDIVKSNDNKKSQSFKSNK